MKYFKIASICLAFLFCSNAMFGQISGSDHDFSTDNWNTSGEICLPCHTPHNAKALTDAPLWNHMITTATYTLYSSPTLDATVAQPTASSKACLSCHDGTVALENFGTVTSGTTMIGGTANLGTDLSNDHPISFTYDDALATTDGELHAPTTTNSGLGSTIQNDLLFNDEMQCSSCHDPHNTPGIDKMLRMSNAASALCLTCHNK